MKSTQAVSVLTLTFHDLSLEILIGMKKNKKLKGQASQTPLKERSVQAYDMGMPLFCKSDGGRGGGGNGLFIGEGKEDDKISS